MAVKKLNVDQNDPPSSLSVEAGIEVPTKDVWVVYDDTTPQDVIVDAIQRAKERLIESFS